MRREEAEAVEIKTHPQFEIAVDLDGTITRSAHNGRRWLNKPDLTHIAPPRPFARKVLRTLQRRGARIVIFTGRLDPDAWGPSEVRRQRELVARYLARYKIPCDLLTGYKPGKAFVLIDDKAISFNGEWLRTHVAITERWDDFKELCGGDAR